MPPLPDRTATLLRWSAMAGLVVWSVIGYVVHKRWTDLGIGWSMQLNISGIFMLAPLVTTPLGLALIPGGSPPVGGMFWRWAARLQPLAAALLVGSFWLPSGLTAAAMSVPWVVVGGLGAMEAVRRVVARGSRQPEEACADAALVFLFVGAVWATISRAGLSPIGFQEPIVLLTAVHFHFAGFASALLAGLAGRKLRVEGRGPGLLYKLLAAGAVLGVPLMAAGIVLRGKFEFIAALFLAFSVGALSLLTVLAVIPRLRRLAPSVLLAIACASSMGAMHFAAKFTVSRWRGKVTISMGKMATLHGLLNALGYSLCGLGAWTLMDRKKTPQP